MKKITIKKLPKLILIGGVSFQPEQVVVLKKLAKDNSCTVQAIVRAIVSDFIES